MNEELIFHQSNFIIERFKNQSIILNLLESDEPEPKSRCIVCGKYNCKIWNPLQ